jgi:release factor glutamine methyltransferase
MPSKSAGDKSVRDCLQLSSLPRLERQLLLAHVLQRPRVWLIANDDQWVNPHQYEQFLRLCQRREQGEPIAYLVGQREFMGLQLHVNPAVLIPRPETELLVTHVLEHLAHHARATVLDLGTGSGAIAIALAKLCPQAVVYATDISPAALEVARRNAVEHEVQVHFLQGSWFEALGGLAGAPRFDVIVSNPPYIAQHDEHLQQGDLRFEPDIALTDQADGLSAYRTILGQAQTYLNPGGLVCVEHGFDQAQPVCRLFAQADFDDVKTLQDLAQLPRVTAGTYNIGQHLSRFTV